MFGVLDAMQSIKPEIQTLGLGCCYSYASLVLVRSSQLCARCQSRQDAARLL